MILPEAQKAHTQSIEYKRACGECKLHEKKKVKITKPYERIFLCELRIYL